jgi:Ca2+/Na+ antiporter
MVAYFFAGWILSARYAASIIVSFRHLVLLLICFLWLILLLAWSISNHFNQISEPWFHQANLQNEHQAQFLSGSIRPSFK